ncbi:MAG: hypothetical protein WC273_10660 [Dehalococcoidia bacterium]
MSSFRYCDNLTDEQRAALDAALVVCAPDGTIGANLRAAFAAKPRERVGWMNSRALDGADAHGFFTDRDMPKNPVRVRVTEILGDEEPQP